MRSDEGARPPEGAAAGDNLGSSGQERIAIGDPGTNDGAYASVSNDAASRGVVTGVATGTTDVRAEPVENLGSSGQDGIAIAEEGVQVAQPDIEDDDDDGASTLLDLSGVAEGRQAVAVADLDADGRLDLAGADVEGDESLDTDDLASDL
jgi:hypothetical protein